MPKYNVYIKRTEWGSIEGIEAKNKEEAENIAMTEEEAGNLFWGKVIKEIEEVELTK